MTQFEIYAGIDWSTQTRQVVAVDADGELLGERAFAHSGDGLAEMADWILGRCPEGQAAAAIEKPHGPEVDAAEAEDIPKLSTAASRVGWSGASALVIGREDLRPVPELPGNPRTNRRNADGTDADTLLTEEEYRRSHTRRGRS